MGGYRPEPFFGLSLALLLLGFFVALPLGHQLFHESSAEPGVCPVKLLEGSLLLLSVAVLTLIVLLTGDQGRPAFFQPATQPLIFRGFSFSNRAPPRS